MFNKFQTLVFKLLSEEDMGGSVGQTLGAQLGIFNSEEQYPVKVAMATALPNKKSKKKKKKFPIFRRKLNTAL
jgi:hypothetical protein